MRRRSAPSVSPFVRLARQIAEAAAKATTGVGIERAFDRQKFAELCRDIGHELPTEEEIATLAAEPQPETQAPLVDRTKSSWGRTRYFARYLDVVALLQEVAPHAPTALVDKLGAEIWNAAVVLECLREDRAAPLWQVRKGEDGRWSIRLAPKRAQQTLPKEIQSLVLKARKSAQVWHRAWWEMSPALRALVTEELGGIDALARLTRERPVTVCIGLPPAPPSGVIGEALSAIDKARSLERQIGGRPRDIQRDEAAVLIVCAWARLTGQKPTEKNADLREFIARLSSLFNASSDRDFLGLLNSKSTSSRILALVRKKLPDMQK